MTSRHLGAVRSALFAIVLTLALAASAQATTTGTPPITLTDGVPASVLHGEDVPVTVTAANPSGPYGYNVAFRYVLPAGVSYVAGSESTGAGEPTILHNAPTTGKTTLIWPDVDDLSPASSRAITFKLHYDPAVYDVGDSFPTDAGAYISTQPRDEADFNADGTPGASGAGSWTGSATDSQTTKITAIKVVKSEPHPEGEIPRGVHDNQTVYTLTVTNNHVNPTNAVKLEDYLPAGLEFLGCPDTTDHTTNAPTNPGSNQEYPGSGTIHVADGGSDCVQPDTVETVDEDPDGTGPLPAGVYTHVVWNDIGDFGANDVKKITYAAAIPIRQNTMDWNGAATGNGTAPGTTGAQTANLDNNNGRETQDEDPLLNGAIVGGTYKAPSKPGLAVTDEGTLLRTAEDLAIQKSNDNNGLSQGDLTKWTVDVQTSEYRYTNDVTIHDVVPDGLCPLGDVNETDNTSGDDSECDPVAGHGPSQPYTTVQEQPNGTYDITWDKSTYPALKHLEPNTRLQLTFWTRTRQNYQENDADSTPVLSNDAVTNNIDTHGASFIRCEGGNPDCDSPAPGTKISSDWHDGDQVTDVSGSGKAATGPVLEKTVAANYPAGGDCTNLAAAAYGKTVPAYGPGDKVCWRLRVVFPANLDTHSLNVNDLLPSGIDYVPGSWHATPTLNTVPIDSAGFTSANGRLTWPIGAGDNDVDAGGKVFDVTFMSQVGSPLGHHSGDVEGNLLKFSYQNTAGTSFALRDLTDFKVTMPELALVKGVKDVNGTPAGGNGPNSDHKQVQGGDLVTYRVDVTNNGTADASSSREWDLLPTGISCGDLVLGSISDGGTCVNVAPGQDRVQWSGIAVAHGASKTLTYTVKVPVGVSPDQSFVNTAGVVDFTYVTDDGNTYTLVPANDVVKDTTETPNTTKAQDVSDIYTAAAAVVKTRTTSVTEGGNAASNQATIGETVNYTVTTTIPKGTTMYGTPTVTDPLGTRQTLVPGSICNPSSSCTFDGGTLAAAGITVGESPANTVAATFPTTYANTTGHDVTLVLTFSAKVLDTTANTRGSSLPNTATLTFKDELNRTVTHNGTVNTTIVEPKAKVSKAHTQTGTFVSGQVVDFTVTAGADNASNDSTAHNVTVVDTLPTGTDPVDGSGNAIADGGTVPSDGGIWNSGARTITWTPATTAALGSIAPGGTVPLHYKVKIEDPASVDMTYTNNVAETVSSLDTSVGGVRSYNSTPAASTNGDYRATASDSPKTAKPTIAKTVTPDKVTIGDPVVWHVAVTIPANLRSFDTTVADTVPDGFVVDGYGAITCTSGCLAGDQAQAFGFAPVTNASDGTITTGWYLGDLASAPTDRVYDLVLNGHVAQTYRHGGAQVVDGNTLTNKASLFTDRTDKITTTPTTVPTGFDTTVGPVTATNHVVEPKLAIDKSVSVGDNAYVEGSQHLTYTVKVTNTGTSPAYDADVTDQPDAKLENVVNGTLPSGVTATKTWSSGDHTMSWHIAGPVAAGASVTLTYTADVVTATLPSVLHDGDTIDNTAAVGDYYGVPKTTYLSGDGRYRKYTGPNDSVHLHVAVPDLSIVKTPDNGNAVAGSPSSFTIVVKNTNTHATAHHVVVHDVLDSGLVYTAGTATASPSAGFSETGTTAHTIDWALGSLAPGASVTITVPVGVAANVPDGTTLVNHATTQADEVTPKSDDGSLKVAAKADLQVTKATDHDPVVPGTNIVYTMVTKNNGPSDAQHSTLSDTLPSYLTFVSLDDTANCHATGQVVSCDYGVLTPGQSKTLHVTVKLDPSRTTSILNAVDVATTTTETNLNNNHAEAPNTVKPTADVSIKKTADKSSHYGGDTVTYTLVAHNDGPSTAANVTADDDIPAGLDFVSVTPGSPTCTQASGHVHCDFGSLAPGADRTVTIVTKAQGTPPATGARGTHKITVTKAEQYLTLQPGQTQTVDVSCPNNGIAVDGAVEIVHVDQGAGSPADIQVLEADSVSLNTYRFTVKNTSSGQLQVRPHVTCLPHDTDPDTNTHAIDVGPLKTLTPGTLAPGRYEYTIDTSAGHHPVSPGIVVNSGVARLVGGEPAGNNGWKFTVEVLQTANVTLSLRALDDNTAPGGSPVHVHAFFFQHVAKTFTVQPGETDQLRVSCPVGYEGIVGSYDLPPGVVSLGNVPEPINRDFNVYNTTDHAIDITLDLECISIETSEPLGEVLTIVNTAHVATTTYDPDLTNNQDSATIQVSKALGVSGGGGGGGSSTGSHTTGSTPAAHPAVFKVKSTTLTASSTGSSVTVPVSCSGSGTCSGTVSVTGAVSSKSARSAGAARVRTVVLGKASYKVKAGKTANVTVKVNSKYRSLLKAGKLKSVKVTAGKTTVTRKVKVAKPKKKTSSKKSSSKKH
jgi:fimbrial isopeptide formation D2 family protein/uncharacterized repeat protein (TIGR01451 family)